MVHRCTNADHDSLHVIQVSVCESIKELVVTSALEQIRPLVLVDFAAFNHANTKRLYAFVYACTSVLPFFVPLFLFLFFHPLTIHGNKDLI